MIKITSSSYEFMYQLIHQVNLYTKDQYAEMISEITITNPIRQLTVQLMLDHILTLWSWYCKTQNDNDLYLENLPTSDLIQEKCTICYLIAMDSESELEFDENLQNLFLWN